MATVEIELDIKFKSGSKYYSVEEIKKLLKRIEKKKKSHPFELKTLEAYVDGKKYKPTKRKK